MDYAFKNQQRTFLKIPLFCKALILTLLLFILHSYAGAATRTASVNGNWSNTATWGSNPYPVAGDIVIINSGVTVTVDLASAQCASITINAAAAANGITISGTNALTVTGAIAFNAPTAAFSSTLAVGAGTLSAGSIAITAGAVLNYISQVTVSTGTITCSGNITFGGTATYSMLTFTGAGTLNVGGNLSAGGTFAASTGTVNCNGTVAQSIGGYTYNTLKVNNTAGVTLLAASTIKTLTIGDVTALSIFNDGGFVITMTTSTLNLTSGTYNLGSAGTGTAWPAWTTANLSAGTTVAYVSGVAQNVAVTPAYKNLTFSGAGTKTTVAGTLSVAGNWTVSSTTALNTNNTIVNLTGNLLGTGNLTQGTGLITVGGDWLKTGTFTAGTGGVTLTGTAHQVTGAAGLTFTTLTVNGTYTNNNPGILTVSTALSGTGTLTQGTNASLAINGTSAISGLNATANTPNLVNFGGAAQTVNPIAYYRLTLSGSAAKTMTSITAIGDAFTISGTANMTGNAALVVGGLFTYSSTGSTTLTTTTPISTGSFTMSAGTLIDNAITITVTGTGASTWTKSGGTFTATGTVNFTGTSPQIGASNFNNFQVSVSNTATLTGIATIAGDLTISTGTFDLATFTADRSAAGGTLTLSANTNLLIGGTNTFPANYSTHTLNATSTVNYYGSNQTVTNETYGNLTLSGSGTKTMPVAVLSVAGVFTTAGTTSATAGATINVTGNVVLGSGTTFNAGSYTHTVGGNWNNNGATFTPSTSTITFNGTAGQVITGTAASQTFYNILIAKTTGTTLSTGGSTTSLTVNNLTETTGNFTAPATLSIGGTLTLNAETFTAGAIINIAGDWTNNGGTFSQGTGTVTFNGTGAQGINGTAVSQTFYNIVVNKTAGQLLIVGGSTTALTLNNFTETSGNFTAPATLTINGSVTITTGTFTAGATITLAGNWVNSGTFSHNNGTIFFNGSTIVSGSSVTSFGAVTINAGHSLTGPASGTMNIGLDFTNNGTFTHNGGTVGFNSTYVPPSGTWIYWGSGAVGLGCGNAGGGPGYFDAAMRYDVTQLPPYGGMALKKISFYAQSGVCTFSVRVWTGANAADLIVDQPVSTFTQNAWNEITLTNPVIIDPSTELWFGYRVTITSGFPASLDPGPSIPNYGDLVMDNGIPFASMYLSQGLNYNWNIKGFVEGMNGGQLITGTTPAAFNNMSVASTSYTSIFTAGQTLKGIVLVNGNLHPLSRLTLLSDATQTALIDGTGTGNVVSKLSIQRYLPNSFGYRYITSPFQTCTVNAFSSYVNLGASFPLFYSYDESKVGTGWVTYTTSTNALNPTAGYCANFGTSMTPVTLNIPGLVTNGAISTGTLYNHNNTYTLGFNLIGNPYPSPVDWNAASGWTKTNIDNALYYFNPGTTDQYTGAYATYINGVSSDGIATNIIPAMQGLFIHVTNGSYPVSGSLGFSNAVRVNNLSPAFHKETQSDTLEFLRLTAGYPGEGITDPAVIYFDNKATRNFDKEYDALKLMNTDLRIPNLYSVSGDTMRLSINSIPVPGDSIQTIPLGLRVTQDGWVEIKAHDIRMPDNLYVFLKDAGAGLIQDLSRNPLYRVNLVSGNYDGRFFIVFSKTDLRYKPGQDQDFYVYSSGGRLYVYLNLDQGEICNLVINNMLGQSCYRQELSGNGYHELEPNLPDGMYVVSLYTNTEKKSKKIYIQNQ